MMKRRRFKILNYTKKILDAVKVIALAEHGEKGIRLLNGKTGFEVKTIGHDGGARLFSNKVCINDEGDHVVIFDTYCTNHEELKRKAHSSKDIEYYSEINDIKIDLVQLVGDIDFGSQ